MNVRPLTVEAILRSTRRDHPLLVGYLLEALVDAARKLVPGFAPREEPPEPIRREAVVEATPAEDTHDARGRFVPRWRRQRS